MIPLPRREGSGRRLADREEIRALLSSGLSPRQTAARLEVSERTVLRARHELGLEIKTPVRAAAPLSEEDHARIRACLAESMSFNEIRRTYGYTHQTLARYYPGQGMDRREAASLGALVRHTNAEIRRNHQQRGLVLC